MGSFRLKHAPRISALAFLLCLLASLSEGQSTSVPPSPECNHDFPKFYTSQTSCDMAQIVCLDGFGKTCVDNLISKLGKMTDRCGTQAMQALLLRQQIMEMLQNASLQVDGFLSEVDSETGHVRAVRNELADRRDAAVGRSNLGSAVGTAGGGLGSALNLGSAAVNTAGNWVSASFGGVGAVFGFLGYFQQSGPMGCFPDLREKPGEKETKDQCPKLEAGKTESPPAATGKRCRPWPKDQLCESDTPPHGCSPRMLYALAFPDCNEEAGFHSSYDDLINKYLKAHAPGKRLSRRATLMHSWGLDDQAKLEAQQDLFTSNIAPRKLSISNLDDRANKLADLRWRVALMHRDLGMLTHDLAVALQCH